VALLNDGEADGLGKVALAGAGAAEEERVLPLGDEAAGGELEDEGPVHLLVEVELEGVEGLPGVAEAGVLDPALEQPVLALEQLVLDEGREKVDRGQRLGLRPSSPTAMPEQRSWRRARCSSTSVMRGPPGSCARSPRGSG
jgi:hypothetical protein